MNTSILKKYFPFGLMTALLAMVLFSSLSRAATQTSLNANTVVDAGHAQNLVLQQRFEALADIGNATVRFFKQHF